MEEMRRGGEERRGRGANERSLKEIRQGEGMKGSVYIDLHDMISSNILWCRIKISIV